VEVTPGGVLSMWAAGLAAGMAVVTVLRIARRGYVWLAGGVTLLFGLVGGAAGAGPWAFVGSACVAVAASIPSRAGAAAALASVGAFALGMGSVAAGAGVAATISGAALLGAVTTEMMLGHWYLVDPQLPRPVLRSLAIGGSAAAALDLAVLAMLGAVPWQAGDAVAGFGFLVLLVTTIVLMGLVWSALGERGYAGVMAATGLSYLAVLTATGGAVVGRLLVSWSAV
jgi:hypothetical protein